MNLAIILGLIFGGIIAIGALFAGMGYLMQQFKLGKNQKVNEDDHRQTQLDRTLRELVEAQEKRYVQLETDHKENLRLIGQLQGKLEEQSKQQKWFESIFVEALQGYFSENPALASELNSKLLRDQRK